MPKRRLSSKVNEPKWTERVWLNFAVLVGLSVVFFHDIFLNPTEMLWGNDIVRADYAFKQAIWRNIWIWNSFPRWDPTILGGRSILGDPIYALLNPASLFFWCTASPLLFGYFAWFHVLLGSFGMYFLARKLQFEPLAALFSAVAFAYSGKTAAHLFAGHLLLVASMLFLPWLMLFVERILETRKPRDVMALGLLAALVITYGTFQIVYTHLVFLGAYVGIRLLINWRVAERKDALRSIGALLASGVVGLALSAFIWLPAVRQTLLLSARSTDTNPEFASMGSAAYTDLLRAIWPFMGVPEPKPLASDAYHQFYWESTIFPGLTALSFAIAALFLVRKERQYYVLASLGLLSLLLALGNTFPLFTVFYHFLPGFSLFRSWGRLLFYTTLVIALLAGRFLHVPAKGRGELAGFFVVFVLLQAVFVGALRWQFSKSGTQEGLWIPLLTLVALAVLFFLWIVVRIPRVYWQASCLMLLCLELLYFWSPNIHTIPPDKAIPDSPIASYLAEQSQSGDSRILDTTNQLPQQLAARYGLELVAGYHPGVYSHYLELYNRIWTQGDSGIVEVITHSPIDIVCPTALDLLNARYLMTKERLPVGAHTEVFRSLPAQNEDITFVYRRETAMPRAYIVGRAVTAPPGLTVLDQLCSLQPKLECLVSEDPFEGGAAYQALVVEYQSPADLVVHVKTDAPGFAVFAESWHPDWRATDNGRDVLVRRVNHAQIAIPVEVGSHVLRVYYYPWDFYLGCVIAVIAASVMVLLLVVSKLQNKVKRFGTA